MAAGSFLHEWSRIKAFLLNVENPKTATKVAVTI